MMWCIIFLVAFAFSGDLLSITVCSSVFLNQVLTSRKTVHALFLKIVFAHDVGMCVCVCVCVSTLRLLITSGKIWTQYHWLIKFYNCYIAAIVDIVSRCSHSIYACHRNQPHKSKLVLYKPSIHSNSHLKQFYISNKMKHFSYKGGCGVHGYTHIKVFKKRADLGYR